MIFRRTVVALIFLLFFSSLGFGTEIGKIYHIKFNWKTQKTVSAFYEMTTYIYQAMGKKREVLFYTEYGNLTDIYLWLSDDDSYAKMQSVISLAKNDYIEAMIDPDSTVRTPLHKIFTEANRGNNEAVCEIHKTMEFMDGDDAWAYLQKMQDLIVIRGHLIAMLYMGKTEKEFDIIFSFFGDCVSKDAIVADLVNILPANSGRRSFGN
ncbi:hypothetical protein MNBD_ALPHA02-77 [hydrothermal vent metagenome]|uniref:Uncharacterized protein n=1 Tax=hydrothermal vent metagenome TaxID=652676 RepID=A0A3B0RJ53_9ZZZZ